MHAYIDLVDIASVHSIDTADIVKLAADKNLKLKYIVYSIISDSETIETLMSMLFMSMMLNNNILPITSGGIGSNKELNSNMSKEEAIRINKLYDGIDYDGLRYKFGIINYNGFTSTITACYSDKILELLKRELTFNTCLLAMIHSRHPGGSKK